MKCELYNDSFQNYKSYQIPKAQLVLTDVPYCYSEDTECLTRNGWKKYTEITYEDEVLSLNHETQEMCYSGIENIIIRDNNEDMYHFSSSNIDLFVSAKHRCYAKFPFVPNLKFGKRLKNRRRVHTDNICLAENISNAAMYQELAMYGKQMTRLLNTSLYQHAKLAHVITPQNC